MTDEVKWNVLNKKKQDMCKYVIENILANSIELFNKSNGDLKGFSIYTTEDGEFEVSLTFEDEQIGFYTRHNKEVTP